MATIAYTATEEVNDFEAIPAGTYIAAIISTDVKPARNNPNNMYLEAVWQIQEGEFGGRQVWQRINLWNENQTAAKIARAQMNQIMKALGLVEVQESEVLHDKPMVVAIKVRPAQGEFSASNEISEVKAIGAVARQPSGNTPPGDAPPDDSPPF